MANCRIRRLRDDDIAPATGGGIMAIESVSFGEHHWSPQSFKTELNNNHGRYFVLVDSDNTVLGYCGLWLVVDEGHITTVAIDPAFRGNALGEVMLVHMLDYCMGKTIHTLTLEVRTSNHAAQNLYYKYGFTSQGLRKKYYQDTREDALIMTTPDILTDEYRTLFKKQRAVLLTRLGSLPAGTGEG